MGELNPFRIFALLYMTAVVVEMSEDWEDPAFTLFFLGVAAVIASTAITRVKFLVFLLLSTAYFLIIRFPDVANHVNLILYCNIAMVIVMAYLIRRRETITDEEYFAAICPLLRVGLILVYFIAGFHKLNKDYFNPDYSCGAEMLERVISTLRTELYGVPVAGILTAIALSTMYGLIRAGRCGVSRSMAFALVVVVLVGCVAYGALAILSPAYFGSPVGLRSIGLVAAALTILWELIGSLLLAVPRCQVVVVPFSLFMHAALAMVGFVDFGALAVALLFTFVPANYSKLLTTASVDIRGVTVNRAHVYFLLNIAGAAYSGLDAHIHPLFNKVIVNGLLFNLAMLILVWPILRTLAPGVPRPAWSGVAVSGRETPRLMYVLPAVLLLFGMSSYFGLRTAGNFSMFSNLRTEGSGSNHLLLRSNSLKIWGYQEDVVRIIKVDPAVGAPIHHFKQLHFGYELPVVEFRKWIYTWTRAGLEVPMTFEYRGRTYTSADVVKDPVWRTDRKTWEMALLDFRVIQPDGPNRCRW